jgi:hypothetical protein
MPVQLENNFFDCPYLIQQDMVAYDSLDSLCSRVNIPNVRAKKANTSE